MFLHPLVAISLAGALLGGAPLFSQTRPAPEPKIVKGQLVWFRLAETKTEVARVLGLPHLSADFGADFHSWQYRDRETAHDEFSHSLVFRRSTGLLVAVTRTYPEARPVDPLFPAAQTRAYCRSGAAAPYCVRLRRFPAGRLLIAGGVSQPGQPTTQLVWIRESELPLFYPWLAP